jgi:hypothetical protein
MGYQTPLVAFFLPLVGFEAFSHLQLHSPLEVHRTALG